MTEVKLGLDSTNSTTLPHNIVNDVNRTLILLLSEKIAQGYHLAVAESEAQYVDSFMLRQNELLEYPIEGAMISLIEPRVPFTRQLELQGVGLDPAVFCYPVDMPATHPSLAWVSVGSDFPVTGQIEIAGLTTRDRVMSLPASLRAGSPIEAAGAGIVNLLNKGFVAMPGGEVKLAPGSYSDSKNPARTLVAETFLGCPRVTHMYRDQVDSMVGMLVAHQLLLTDA